MKRCPYCAEEIQDAAVKCRWCGSDLTVTPDKVVANPPPGLMTGQPAPSEAPAMEGEHQAPMAMPGAAVQAPAQEPEEDRGWAQAPAEAPAQTAEQPVPKQAPAGVPVEEEPTRGPEILSPPHTPSPSPNITFSHEGPRYLLGYTAEYYGIWDKDAPGPPVGRFARTDPGWQEAWEAFIRMEMGQS